MADVYKINKSTLTGIADEVRRLRRAEGLTYTPDGMKNALSFIPLGDYNNLSATAKDGQMIFHVPEGYYLENNYPTYKVTEEITYITPTKEAQEVTNRYTLYFNPIVVNPIPNNYIDASENAKTSSDVTVNGANVSVPSGYYSEAVTKSVATTTHGKPTLAINSSTGVVTAQHEQTVGYVAAGTTSNTLNLSVQAAKTITPTKSSQVAVEAGKYTTGAISVAAIPSQYVDTTNITKTASDVTVSGASVTTPAGYYTNAVTKSVATATHPTPSVSINKTTGVVTASHAQTTGYVTGGTTTGTLNLTVQDAKTVTPGTSNQIAVAADRYTTGAVTVQGDANLVANNIIKGKSIFGVAGNVEFVEFHTGSSKPADSFGNEGDLYFIVED